MGRKPTETRKVYVWVNNVYHNKHDARHSIQIAGVPIDDLRVYADVCTDIYILFRQIARVRVWGKENYKPTQGISR
jgi:hypothetical protein